MREAGVGSLLVRSGAQGLQVVLSAPREAIALVGFEEMAADYLRALRKLQLDRGPLRCGRNQPLHARDERVDGSGAEEKFQAAALGAHRDVAALADAGFVVAGIA